MHECKRPELVACWTAQVGEYQGAYKVGADGKHVSDRSLIPCAC